MRNRVFVLVCALLISQAAWAEETRLEIIPLKHLTVEQAIPLVQPFAGQEGVVRGMNNQLIVRATPASLQQIKQVLDSVDKAPRRLLITVKQDNGTNSRDSAASLAARVGQGDVRATVGDPPADLEGAELRLRRTDTQEDDAVSQRLQVTEGYEAFIQVGQSVPVPESSVGVAGGAYVIHDSIQFKDVTTGFSVVPRVNGDIVTLDINPHRGKLNQNNGSIAVQRISTTVSGHLGEWIDIGGNAQDSNRTTHGILSSTDSVSSTQGHVLLKVESLD